MQIRTLFYVSTCVLAGMAATLGCGVLTHAVTQYRIAERTEHAVDVSALLLAAADRLAVERPTEGDMLLHDAPATTAALTTLAAVRADTDQAFTTVKNHIAALSYRSAAEQLDIVNNAQDQLAALRHMADPMIVLPKSQRQPALFERYLSGFSTLFDRLDAAEDLRDVAAAQKDGMTMDLIDLARQVWSVRRILGVRTAPVMAVIDSGSSFTAEQLEAQAKYDGAIAQGRAAIESLLRRLATIRQLQASGAVALAAITEHNDLLHASIAAGRNGGPYPMPALALGRSAVQAGLRVLTLRDAALYAARARVADAKRFALTTAILVAVAVALILAATAATLLQLNKRLVKPVLGLTDVIGRLAQRDYDVAISAGRSDELGRMAEALETLRRGAIAAEAAEAQIAHLAHHDILTGLANRRTLQDHLNQAIAATTRGRTCALLCLDLDRFKAVNDTYGHPVGDQLLKAVAERLLLCVREVDTVSRFGGDEFAVLLVDVDKPESAGVVAGRIVQSLSQPFELGGLVVEIGTSVGIALAPQDARSAVALLKSADTALYSVKHEEKGSFRFFASQMQAALHARSELEQDLREAVRDGSFQLLYQPQFLLATQRIIGFEAFLRWHHPLRGVVGPGDFIPLAESIRLITPISAWVLQQACADAMTWPDGMTVAVNMSAVQFKSPSVVATVREALETSGLPAYRLTLEVTESVLLSNKDAELSTLRELADMGIRIALDDFGTGYASLSYLQRFAFDKIKIDRTFVSALSPDPRSLSIVRAVVGLGRDLGMEIAAVGVETQEQLDRLQREGCTEAQGFLLGTPLPSQAVGQFLVADRRVGVTTS